MADEIPVGRFPFKRPMSAFRIFEIAGLALSPASVVIAVLGAILLGLSGWLVDRIVPFDSSIAEAKPVLSQNPHVANTTNADGFAQTIPTNVGRIEIDASKISKASSMRFPISTVTIPGFDPGAMHALLRPWSSIIHPAMQILTPSPGTNGHLNGALRFALSLGLWSFVGLVLCRRSAFVFNGNDDSSLQNAIQFGSTRLGASVGAPLIPLAAAMLIGVFAAMIGLAGQLPFLGSTWLWITSPLLMIMGFAMAFLMLATAVGWPLMVSAVSIDDCDSFGGLSRAYSGMTGRPWQLLGHGLLSLFVGIILMRITQIVAETTIWCAMSSTAWGSGEATVLESLQAPLTSLVDLTVSGIGISYFWSAATVIYLLMRQEIDGVPLDRIALDDDARPVRDPLPVVGIPATDARSESNGSVPVENR